MKKSLNTLLTALSLTLTLSACQSTEDGSKAESQSTEERKDSSTSSESSSVVKEQESSIQFNEEKNIEDVKQVSLSAFENYYTSKLGNLDTAEKSIASVVYLVSCKRIEELAKVSNTVEEAISLANSYYEKMQEIIGALSCSKANFDAYYNNAINVVTNIKNMVSTISNEYSLEWIESIFEDNLKALQDKSSVKTVSDVETILSSLSVSVKNYVETIVSENLIILITTAKTSALALKNVAIAKISDAGVVKEIESVYKEVLVKLESITDENNAENLIQEAINEYKDTILKYGEDLLASTIEEYRAVAMAKLDEIVKPLLDKIPVATLKTKLQEFYDAEVIVINNTTSEELAKSLLAKVKDEAAKKVSEVLASYKTEILSTLETMVSPVLAKIEDDTLKNELQSIYNTQKDKIEALEEASKAPEVEQSVKEALQQKVTEVVGKALVSIKSKGIEALDKIVAANITKITDETLKKELQDYYDEEKSKIEAINDLDTAKATIDEIKDDTTTFATELVANALLALKNKGLKELDALVNPLIEKLDDATLKTNLTNFYNTQKGKIEAINSVDTASASLQEIKDDSLEFVNSIKGQVLNTLKQNALDELETLVNSGLAKINDKELKDDLTEFYNDSIAKVNAINDMDTAKATIKEIKDDTEAFVIEQLGKALLQLKATALDELDALVKPLIDNVSDDTIKADINTFYNNTKKSINDIDSIDTAKESLQEIKEDALDTAATLKTRVINALKAKAKDELDDVVETALAKISDTTLQNELNTFYATESAKITNIRDLDTAKSTADEVLKDTEDFVKDLLVRALVAMKNKGIQELDGIINPLIEKITDQSIKTDLTNYYNQEKALIEAVSSIDNIDATIVQVKKDTNDYVATLKDQIIASIKQTAKNELNLLVTEGLSRLPDGELKTRLNTFKTEQIEKIDDINSVDSASEVADEVIEDTKLFVKELISDSLKTIKTSMKSALSGANALNSKAPTTYVPAAMLPNYSANLVNASDITYDFTSFTNISDINYGGYGEQWNMVINSLNKADSIYSVITKSETVLSAAATAVNTYLDSKYADEVEHTISDPSGTFVAVINYEEGIFTYDVTISAGVTIPGFGSIVPTIHVEYDNAKSEKVTKISINENNLIKVVQVDNDIQIGVKFGTADYSTSSLLSIEEGADLVTGHINEFVTAKGKDLVSSAADFYINDTYVSAVGNKADGLTGFKGYINELYKKNEGKLLGYEIQETLTILGVSGTYNTLWFNLDDISGINNIKVTEKTSANKSGSSTVDVYLNDSTSLFVPTYNKIAIKTTSRKYDIEYRTRYFYSYDETTKEYTKHEVSIPMMFIQEGDNYNSYTEDMNKANSITSSVTMNSADLQKVLDDYDNLIPVFIENKDTVTSETVSTFLSE